MKKATAAFVTQFDWIVVLMLGVSGLIGCLRGGAREVMTVLAFILGTAASIFSLRFIGPFFAQWIHPAWAGKAFAALLVFFVVYLAVRIAGARLTHTVRHIDTVSVLDRVVGLGFGLVRGAVLLGVFQLMLLTVMPAEHPPGWIVNAKLYPLAVDSGHALSLLAPQGSAVANQLAPTLEHAVTETPDGVSDQAKEKSR